MNAGSLFTYRTPDWFWGFLLRVGATAGGIHAELRPMRVIDLNDLDLSFQKFFGSESPEITEIFKLRLWYQWHALRPHNQIIKRGDILQVRRTLL